MATYGSNAVADLLATQFNTSTIKPEFDNIFQVLTELLQIHNANVEELVTELVAGTTTERLITYGGGSEMDMTELDENGTPEAQKTTVGTTMGLPLKLWGRSLAWNKTWFEEKSPRELGALMDALFLGDVKNISLALRTAFFRPTNYTFYDLHVDNATLSVKALMNADSSSAPVYPSGAAVDTSTHTHYLGVATFTAAGLNSLVATVQEHFTSGQTVLWIPSASEASIRALNGTNEFIADTIPGVVYGSASTTTTNVLTTNNMYNRRIGIWGTSGVPVFVKPLVPANYVLCKQEGVPPPVVRRVRNAESAQLRMRFEGQIHPYGYEVFERKFGFGVQNRLAAAVLQTNNSTYSIPTLVA